MFALSRPALEVVVDAPKAVTIFGREPAAVLGLIEAALVALIAFGLGVTNESAGLITALLSLAIGAYQAWATKDTFLAALTGVAKAALALLVYYGVTLTSEQISAIVTFLPISVGFWLRDRTSPVAFPVDPSPTQVVDSPLEVTTPDATIYSSDSKTDAAGHEPKGA